MSDSQAWEVQTASMCLIVLATFISARLAIFLTWLFNNEQLTRAMPSGLVGVLGFLFLPWTTLAYTYCYAPVQGVQGLGWFIVILAFFVDLGSYGSSDRYRRNRTSY